MLGRAVAVWESQDVRPRERRDGLLRALASGPFAIAATVADAEPDGSVASVTRPGVAICRIDAPVGRLLMKARPTRNAPPRLILAHLAAGEAEVTAGRHDFLMGTDDLLVLGAADSLEIEADDRLSLRLFALAGHMLEPRAACLLSGEPRRTPACDPLNQAARGCLAPLAAIGGALPETVVADGLHHAAQILSHLGERELAGVTARIGPKSIRLAEAQALIASQFRDPAFGPETAARALGCSVRYLHLLFHQTNSSFGQSLLGHRLEVARGEVRRNGRPITEIAYDCGFNDLSTFNRCFRKYFGMTPREARVRAAMEPQTEAAS